MPKFVSKNHAMNQRHIVWVCKFCNTPHDKTQLRLAKRPEVCLNCKTQQNFYFFASRAESKRYSELWLQQKVGHITELKTQVIMPIVINGIPITRYIADFTYKKNNEFIVEDVKGNKDYLTDVFKLKAKLVQVIYGVKILITERS